MSKKTFALREKEIERALDEIDAEREGIDLSDCTDFPVSLRTDDNYVIGMAEERPDDSMIELMIHSVLLSR
jgi:hypothetical protein